ncbi:MAG: AAA family ATPase [Proteobacteria bacterium]|nr:AAA family ATPase [Pseudomonadota bacterium]
MYAEFYRLKGLPFQLGPDPRFFFGSSVHQKAEAYLTYGLEQGEGFIVITGEVGAGKTTLVGHLFSTLDSHKYIAAKVVTTQLDAEDTLRMVASAFGVPSEGLDKASLLRRIEQFLVSNKRGGKRALLVIDEVQNLSVRSIEELRMLSNFQVENQTLLQSFLVGQPQFRATLASPELEQLRQRVIATYHLGPLTAEETRQYVEHRLRTVGWADDPRFSVDSFGAIFKYTGGVPRRINTLCSRLLLYGFLDESHVIDGAIVDKVAQELAQEVQQVAAVDGNGVAATAAPLRAAGTAMAPPAAGELRGLADRVSVLERNVQAHDRTIKKVFSIASEYLAGQRS